MAKKQAFVSASMFMQSKRESLKYSRIQLANLRANQVQVAQAARLANAIIGKITRVHAGLPSYSYCYANTSGYHMDKEIRLDITTVVENVLALDCETVRLAVNALRSAGFERVGEMQKVANEYSGYASWKFMRQEGTVKTEFEFRAVLAQEGTAGATCRKVQVGTELKEVAKYAIVCG